MKIQIKYPQVYIETKIIEVDDERGEDVLHGGVHEQADFIKQNLTENEIDWLHGNLSQALEYDFAHIKKMP